MDLNNRKMINHPSSPDTTGGVVEEPTHTPKGKYLGLVNKM